KLVELVEEAKISHLAIEVDTMKIEIKKELTAIQANVPIHIPATAPTPSPSIPVEPVEKSTPLPEHDDKLIPIKSQMVGTFYTSSSPETSPYVAVGDTIKVGQVLCIIEAMKLFNEIESEIAGVVEKISIPNGTPVEYGQTLFLIRIG